MIIVKGSITLSGIFEVELDMTEDEFDGLRKHHQNEEIESTIDWMEFLNNCEVVDVDIDELEEE